MTKIDLTFRGIITNRSPLHISPPNSPVLEIGKSKGAEVATLPVVRNGQMARVPVIPASTLRGKLRRAAVSVCLSKLGGKPSLSAYLYSALGGIKGSESEDVFSIAERNRRRAANPVVGLFGASAPWDASTAYIANAIPDINIEPEWIFSVRSDDFSRNPELADILDTKAVPEYLASRKDLQERAAATQDVQAALTKRGKMAKAGENTTAIDTEIAKLREVEASLKEEAGNSTLMPLAHRVLPVGVPMSHTMTLKSASEAEAGLFIQALNHVFEEDPFLGGKISLGYGAFDGEWSVSLRENGKWNDVGVVSGTTLQPLTYKSDALSRLVGAWEAYAASDALSLDHQKAGK